MLLGFGGGMGSGKDEAFARLQRIIPYATRVAFADKLKVSAMRALGITTPEDLTMGQANALKSRGSILVDLRNGTPPFSITGRQYLQYYGTEAHREVFGDDFWVDQALRSVLGPSLDHTDEFVVVTDCRFPNEAERIRELGGRIWQISGPTTASKSEKHASEAGLPDGLIDWTIDNSVRDDNFALLDAELEAALAVALT